ncbi:MAG: SPOR domain-containing protein [Candidatus Omnitrophota bacterium]
MATKLFTDKKERDLFDHQANIAEKKIKKKVKFLLPPLKNSIVVTYENIIFLIIVFIMSSIIFFSLGVEKGRQELSSIKKEVKSVSLNDLSPKKEEVAIAKDTPGDRVEAYIIRLASFSEKASAVKEQEALKKDGYEASIRRSGDYYQLYIGGFTNKGKAAKLQQALTNKYKDCYITNN